MSHLNDQRAAEGLTSDRGPGWVHYYVCLWIESWVGNNRAEGAKGLYIIELDNAFTFIVVISLKIGMNFKISIL